MNKAIASAIQLLRQPDLALQKFGQVIDQKTGKFVPYDPYRLTHQLQSTIVAYYSHPPVTSDDQTIFLNVLGYRQGGKSVCGEYAGYVKTAYNPGWDHVCYADVRPRAEYLHGRVHHLHARWPEAVRSPTMHTRESLQLTFDRRIGGKMRVLSADKGFEGVGQSPDSLHASEVFVWKDMATSYSFLLPSMINRDHALWLTESTPGNAGSDWHDHYRAGKWHTDRFRSVFFPFWDGVLNTRPWPEGEVPTNEELRLIEKYGRKGLSLDNLAFRRLMLSSDTEIRRRPELFGMYYPFDDVTCWVSQGSSAIPSHALDRHLKGDLVEWKYGDDYVEYLSPNPNATYVIGVDPSGYAARDHVAFQVLEVWSDAIIQAATFAAHRNPIDAWRSIQHAGYRYNKALLGIESNGVGQGILTLADSQEYPNVLELKVGNPGIAVGPHNIEQLTAQLIDALMDRLILYDSDLVDQLGTYKGDKATEQTARAEMLGRIARGGRRDRHHWDKVSALMMAVETVKYAPTRIRSGFRRIESDNAVLFPGMTWEHWEKLQREQAEEVASRGRARYGVNVPHTKRRW